MWKKRHNDSKPFQPKPVRKLGENEFYDVVTREIVQGRNIHEVKHGDTTMLEGTHSNPRYNHKLYKIIGKKHS